ncbi:response regulator [Cohnella nanjingensis]|uniref:Response regulator n=1 Tax=Cohnella nanjingensis TaxID=1387779 RepID=A0A7X0RR26_9BACL|nr:response regulator [Cohnella nanjingensis]MBB6671976.1 response regulator [Cohnella nanjingensis]
MIKAFIVEDEPLVRRGIRSMLPLGDYGMEWVGEASSAEEALEALERSDIDLLFTDISMPGMDGLELVRTIKSKHPRVRSVVLTCHQEFDYLQQALRLGAIDYMVKTQLDDDSVVELLERLAKQFEQAPLSERQADARRGDDREELLDGWRRMIWFMDDAEYNAISGFVLQSCQAAEWRAVLAEACEAWLAKCPSLEKLKPLLAELDGKRAMHDLGVWARAVRAEVQKLLRNTMYSEEVIHAILRAVDLLNEHTGGKISQPDICRAINMSISYFSKSFKEIVGLSFVVYVQEINIRSAQRLLQTTNAPIYQVSEQAGFHDEKYFGKIFRQKTGLTPSEYRLRFREQ